MAAPTDRIVCAVRAFVLASVTVVLSLVLHSAAGGHSSDLLAVAILIVLTALGAYRLSRAPMTFGRAVLLFGTAQAGFHGFFDLTATSGHGPSHTGHAAVATLSPIMIAAHVLATAICAAIVVHGDRLLRSVWSWLVGLWLFSLVVPAPYWAPTAADIVYSPLDLRQLAAQASRATRRGPPHVFV
ncbi:hypothetical protein [Hoyosella subflava]|uniref:Uncharacterized protein n=1 Tax=Hoyosella subflava (strain DSM 45089 / JCM 17490 / NBRC 109087 / DQS3-9A1) TaxID=443218 RepID=F6ELQ1_HOYSD|nr:hypothetical protein [Hoyosella subflava]AEF41499.1 hypothetical protein AS9A_3054 [Hoyosella subflava DQS3-9A1]